MTEETQAQAPSLSLNDISNVVQVIDMVSSRGAIRGDELAPVGILRERFVAFLKASQDAQPAAVEGADEIVEDADTLPSEMQPH
jgi:hypothetical protein